MLVDDDDVCTRCITWEQNLLNLDRDTRRWRQAEDGVGMELELRVVLGEEESICAHLPVSDIEGFGRL